MVVAVVEAGQMYFVRTDHIGRPVFATDDLGAVVWEASYLPFGGVQTSTGANSELRFPGQWFQSETALHQNWMRDYDPTLGRYIQADPLGLVDGASVYGYALQNPERYIDPRGENKTIYEPLPFTPAGLNNYWVPNPNQHPMAPLSYIRVCAENEMLEFHPGNAISGGHQGASHWHYSRAGTLRTRDRERYPPNNSGFGGGDHLPPLFPIPVTDCTCAGGNTGTAVGLAGIGALGILKSLAQGARGGGGRAFPQLPHIVY